MLKEAKEEDPGLITESMIRRDLDKLFSRPVSPGEFEKSPEFRVLSSQMDQLFLNE